MKTKFQKPRTGYEKWCPPPARYSITRLEDGWERFTPRKPRRELCRNHNFMVWDHEEKTQIQH